MARLADRFPLLFLTVIWLLACSVSPAYSQPPSVAYELDDGYDA